MITNKRTVNTNVLIEDGGIVVLGGLIRDSANRGEQRVPYLGRIPLIGELFVSVSKKYLLARRSAEIGDYFARPEYSQELALLLEEHHRRYAQSQPAEP